MVASILKLFRAERKSIERYAKKNDLKNDMLDAMIEALEKKNGKAEVIVLNTWNNKANRYNK